MILAAIIAAALIALIGLPLVWLHGWDRGQATGYRAGYRNGWEQHKFDAEMDAANPDTGYADLYGTDGEAVTR